MLALTLQERSLLDLLEVFSFHLIGFYVLWLSVVVSVRSAAAVRDPGRPDRTRRLDTGPVLIMADVISDD